MKTFIPSLKTLLFVAIGLAYSYIDYGQIYQYTDDSSRVPFAFDSNTLSGSLTRTGLGSVVSCNGTTDGFGSKFTAPFSGGFITFTIAPKPKYRLNITGFSAYLRSPSTPSGGPTTARYSYTVGVAGDEISDANSAPLGASTLCNNVGQQRN